MECDRCDFETDSGKGLKIHTSQVHDTESAKKTYTCSECGGFFEDYPSRRETRGREQFFCSRECKDLYQKGDGLETTCDTCGSDIYVHPSHTSDMGDYSIDHHFCDKECEREWKRENWVGEDHPSWAGGDVATFCHQCGKPTTYRAAQVPESGTFCSIVCKNKYGAQNQVKLTCPICEASFRRKPWKIRGDTATCSDECRWEYMSQLRTGDGNPAWNGGKARYYGPGWSEQRRAALERDGYKCQLCFMGSEEHQETYHSQLPVHHIVRFKTFEDSAVANELDNLVTLCMPCHKTLEPQSEVAQRELLATSTPEE